MEKAHKHTVDHNFKTKHRQTCLSGKQQKSKLEVMPSEAKDSLGGGDRRGAEFPLVAIAVEHWDTIFKVL